MAAPQQQTLTLSPRESALKRLAREVHADYRANCNPKVGVDPEDWLDRAARKFYAWIAEWNPVGQAQDDRNPYSRAAAFACAIKYKASPGPGRKRVDEIALDAGERLLVHEGARYSATPRSLALPLYGVLLRLSQQAPDAHYQLMAYYASRYEM